MKLAELSNEDLVEDPVVSMQRAPVVAEMKLLSTRVCFSKYNAMLCVLV